MSLEPLLPGQFSFFCGVCWAGGCFVTPSVSICNSHFVVSQGFWVQRSGLSASGMVCLEKPVQKVTLLGVCVSALLRLLGGQNPLVSGPDAPTCPHRWLRKCGLQGVDYVLTLEGQGCLYLSRQGCQTPSRFLRVVAQALRKVGRSCYSVCCKGGGHSMVSVDQNYIRQLGLCIFSGRICETDGGRPLPVESRIGIRRCLQN